MRGHIPPSSALPPRISPLVACLFISLSPCLTLSLFNCLSHSLTHSLSDCTFRSHSLFSLILFKCCCCASACGRLWSHCAQQSSSKHLSRLQAAGSRCRRSRSRSRTQPRVNQLTDDCHVRVPTQFSSRFPLPPPHTPIPPLPPAVAKCMLMSVKNDFFNKQVTAANCAYV